MMILFLFLTTMASPNPPIALPNCQDHCGNISIPYPFGIGNCSYSSWFQISCNASYNPPRAYFTRLNWTGSLSTSRNPLQILNIVVPTTFGEGSTVTVTGSWAGLASGSVNAITTLNTLDMRGTPFLLMGLRNTFVVFGCGGSAVLRNSSGDIIAGCATVCSNISQLSSSSCYGNGCCQTSVPNSIDYFEMAFLATIGDGKIGNSIEAVILNTSYLANTKIISGSLLEFGSNPTILNWKLLDFRTDSKDYSNTSCIRNGSSIHLWFCTCKQNYQGNPYLPNGCQVIKECEQCPDNCFAVGNDTYKCFFDSAFSAISTGPSTLLLGLGTSLGSISLFLLLYGLYRFFRKRKEIRQKQNNFKKNGGLLLQQQMSTGEGVIEKTKVFTSDELEKATDNFNENRILGRGGQGTVYKGMLIDGTIIAVKKSKEVDENQLGQFINEVVILSQVNHRNVVKLFGCCLETHVPLLVYEFVPNGTLYQHIHDPSEDVRINWKMRLRIAIESAEAIAYLHSASSTPIYHRDIKTSNILLDDKYKAKVSDFGTSKTLSIDQTHVTTCVQGTFGYIDPEFFQSNQFTEKSDVYSFGIVILELLTSKRPIHADTSLESRSLASHFLLLVQNSRLYDIVDPEILEEARKEEVEGIAKLVKQCLKLNGKQRPTMKEVAMALQTISSLSQKNLKQKTSFLGDQIHVVDEGLLSKSRLSSSSEKDTQPLLFSTF